LYDGVLHHTDAAAMYIRLQLTKHHKVVADTSAAVAAAAAAAAAASAAAAAGRYHSQQQLFADLLAAVQYCVQPDASIIVCQAVFMLLKGSAQFRWL
jgi:signal recognition particle GTPase